MRSNFYVYEWYNVENDEVFYVGKGTGDRYKVIAGRNDYFKNYHAKYNCAVRKVKDNLKESDAFALEVELISKYKNINQCQCNLTDGGEGAVFTEGSWDDIYRKLRMIYYSPKSGINYMHNADDYYYENLKTKSLEELIQLYEDYESQRLGYKMHKDIYEDFKKSNPSNLNYMNMSIFEIETICKEIKMLTDICSNAVAKDNSEFEDLLECKNEIDYMCLDVDTDKFIDMLLLNTDYQVNLIHAFMVSMWALKRNGDYSRNNVHMKIKTFSLKNNRFLYIRFNSKFDKQLKSIKIDIYDLIWGILIFENKPLYQIIYEEMLVAPFI